MPPIGIVTRRAPVARAATWTTVARGRLPTFVGGGHGLYAARLGMVAAVLPGAAGALAAVALAGWLGALSIGVALAVGWAAGRRHAPRGRAYATLEAELRAQTRELRESRARLAHGGDAERRRIGRDLHDGCQQRLIALRIKLGLAEELVDAENAPVQRLIEEVAADGEAALEGVHAVVHGVHPSLLVDRGLADAFRGLARSAPMPVRVLAESSSRYPAEVEAAVYFACAEALQNAAKHAGGLATARIVLRHDGSGLAFEVRDDGRGFGGDLEGGCRAHQHGGPRQRRRRAPPRHLRAGLRNHRAGMRGRGPAPRVSARMTAGSAAGLWPLAEAKLAAPRQRTGLVDRPRIMQILDAGADTALTLVAAPPGFGKSTAVRAWCATRSEPLAWVTLDARDNDPVRLWTYVATAVDRIRPGLGRRTLGQLGATADVSGPLDELLNRIGGFGTELVIVLDDLQTVTDREALASIDYAVEHLPANARLIVITRIDPALGLARLRAGGALAELRADDLAFTVAEARELLVERGKLAPRRRRDRVAARTHGGMARRARARDALASARARSSRRRP